MEKNYSIFSVVVVRWFVFVCPCVCAYSNKIQITRGRADFNADSSVKVDLAPSFEPVTFETRFSSICSCTFLTGFGPNQVASTLGSPYFYQDYY